jgi:replicative DNA helicase
MKAPTKAKKKTPKPKGLVNPNGAPAEVEDLLDDSYLEDLNDSSQKITETDPSSNGKKQSYVPRHEQYLEKPLPSSEEAERTILGGILLDNSMMSQVADKLQPEDFYSPLNRKIYSAMSILFSTLRPIDPILIMEELKKQGPIEAIGGISTISNLTFGLHHFSTLEDYSKVIIDKSKIRRLIRACNEITTDALGEEEDSETVLNLAETRIYEITQLNNSHSDFVDGSLEVHARVQAAVLRGESGEDVQGRYTGLPDVDHKLQGLKNSDLIILAGRPSMGKTGLGTTITLENGIRRDTVVADFTLEMSLRQMVDRMIISEARVDSLAYGAGHLTHEEWERIYEARDRISACKNIFIDDSVDQTIGGMRSKLRRLNSTLSREDKKVGLMIVDYLQLMEGMDRRRSRENDVSEFSRGLKKIAKEFEIPVIALSQLSRKPEDRASHKPLMSDLRESGAIEQDADVVAFVFREDYYIHDHNLHSNEAEIIIGKNRNGPTGTVKVRFDGPSMRFDSLTHSGNGEGQQF